MNSPYPSSSGPQRPVDGWGRPQSAAQPQTPGPESVYETPDEFASVDAARNGAASRTASEGSSWSGASWNAGPRTSSESPVPGMSAQDFQKMCQSVDKAFSQFAQLVNKAADGAAQALGQSPEKNLKAYQELEAKRKAQKKAQKKARKEARKAAQASAAYRSQGGASGAPTAYRPQSGAPGAAPAVGSPAASPAYQAAYAPVGQPLAQAKKRFRSSWGLTASGALMTAAGGAGTVVFGGAAITGLIMGAVAAPAGVATAVIFGLLTAGAVTVLGLGISCLRKASRLKALKRIMGNREVCNIDELAQRLQLSPKATLATVRRLIKNGYLPEGRLDDNNQTLMVTDNAYHQYLQFQQAQRQTLADQQAAAEARAAEEAAQAAAQAVQQARTDRLTPVERAFIDRGQSALQQMAALNARIDDAAVSQKVTALEEVTARILARAEEEPKVIAGLDRLNDYYLPTTLKLLEAYDALEEQPVQGENIASSRREIEHTLDVLNSAFEKLLDDTFQELNMDVSADISVLHALLAQEGLTDGPFDAKP
ncbi:5-bromo-4-chloroindolyl phosphate hydrolysis family protein [uncultured Adlercreutzia sp.]|uniref:5-bromo-4-chloroindolyl phosphate hydrolysis family protein n=2 Tax=uncultured Adlercreutzia sp. TaxID=875803 RepID=UPI0025CFA0FF|nr:5-bromo-4-chloroindolyl phosphate hydrolysis family protein [uncultured Adlercreutzia sp.]